MKMDELFELLGQLEEMAAESERAPLLRKAAIGMRISKKSLELTHKSFEFMEDIERRMEVLEKKKR